MFVRRDERGELGSRELVELREQTFHRDRATVEATLEHDRAAASVPGTPRNQHTTERVLPRREGRRRT